ncbi:hypothetical protein B0H14DRAFT_3444257 [Mycena olivaceomarginata]|nr:hypothetical protein B0H14DRAFT_3444257 [Mycena olivaceomarginata]
MPGSQIPDGSSDYLGRFQFPTRLLYGPSSFSGPYMVPRPAPYLSTEQLYNHPSPFAALETTIAASDDAVNTTRKRASSMSDETPAAAKRGRGRLRKDANAYVPAKPNLFYRTY